MKGLTPARTVVCASRKRRVITVSGIGTKLATGKQKALHIGYGADMSLAEARVEFARLKSQRRAGHAPELPESLRKPVHEPPAEAVAAYTVAAMVEDYV